MKETETDWDDGDDGVIDFDQQPKPATVRDEPPKPAQKYIEPPPAAAAPKQEKMISDAAKAAKQLSQELETLDFQLEKFNKFEQKVSSFKIKNTIAIGSIALLLGGYIGSSAQSELYTYYVQQEVKHKLSEAAAELELIKIAKDNGVIFAQDGNRIVVYTTAQNRQAAVWEDKNHKGLQLTLQK